MGSQFLFQKSNLKIQATYREPQNKLWATTSPTFRGLCPACGPLLFPGPKPIFCANCSKVGCHQDECRFRNCGRLFPKIIFGLLQITHSQTPDWLNIGSSTKSFFLGCLQEAYIGKNIWRRNWNGCMPSAPQNQLWTSTALSHSGQHQERDGTGISDVTVRNYGSCCWKSVYTGWNNTQARKLTGLASVLPRFYHLSQRVCSISHSSLMKWAFVSVHLSKI